MSNIFSFPLFAKCFTPLHDVRLCSLARSAEGAVISLSSRYHQAVIVTAAGPAPLSQTRHRQVSPAHPTVPARQQQPAPARQLTVSADGNIHRSASLSAAHTSVLQAPETLSDTLRCSETGRDALQSYALTRTPTVQGSDRRSLRALGCQVKHSRHALLAALSAHPGADFRIPA